MGKICLQCGDIGHKKELVYCFKCMQAARHRYCMDAMPKMKDEIIRWLCDECKSSNGSSCSKKSLKRNQEKVSAESDKVMISSKKNLPGKKSGGIGQNNNFLYSFTGFRAGIMNPAISRAKGIEQEEQSVIYAEPLIRSVWTGDMIFYDDSVFRTMDGACAFLSSKACQKACETAAQFGPVLRFEMASRSNVWPKSFQGSAGPTDDNIAVYFFPSLSKLENYDYLLFEMIRDDLAMRAFVHEAELLIFASTMLPSRFWRFQGRLYLWGVFRGKKDHVDM